LFASDEIVQIILTGPFTTIDRERNKDKEYSGELTYLTAAGAPLTLDLRYQVRGNYRLQRDVCRYSQLWLNFRTRQAAGSLFANQDRVKLVVQCGAQRKFAEYLVKELQAYQFFNRLSDQSFSVRLAEITYRDPDYPRNERTHTGFFIEHHDRLASRLGLSDSKVDRLEIRQLDPVQGSLVALFMYMIGNTDYSMLTAEPGENCCHNIRLLKGGDDRYIPVPYDFDASGYVDADYAPLAASLRQTSTRQRIYRGFCSFNEEIDASLDRFREQQQAVTAIIDSSTLVSRRQVNRARDFIAGFYNIISDPDRTTREFITNCRGAAATGP